MYSVWLRKEEIISCLNIVSYLIKKPIFSQYRTIVHFIVTFIFDGLYVNSICSINDLRPKRIYVTTHRFLLRVCSALTFRSALIIVHSLHFMINFHVTLFLQSYQIVSAQIMYNTAAIQCFVRVKQVLCKKKCFFYVIKTYLCIQLMYANLKVFLI